MIRLVRLSLFTALGLTACGPAVLVDEGSTGEGESSSMATTDEGSSVPPNPSSPSPTSPGSGTGNASTVTTSPPDATTVTTSPPETTEDFGSSDSGSTVTGSNFLPDPACTDGPCSSSCDVWEQDCAEGDACKPWANDGGMAWNDTRCAELDPDPAQLGDACTVEGSSTSGIDSCDIGLMCWDVDGETLEGTCIGLCEGTQRDSSCADPGTTCVVFNEGALPICLLSCDIEGGIGCPPDMECYPASKGDVCVSPAP